jgi:cAMP-dependent protein kinase regulator
LYFQNSPEDTSGAMDRSEAKTIADRERQLQIHAKASKNKNREALRGRMIDFDGEFKPPVYAKSDEERTFLDKALGQNFIFSDLTIKEREMLINSLQKQEAKEGELIIKQGDVGDFFYICEEGTVNFIADGNAVGSCGIGGSFGELALLYDSPRAATCIAGSDCVLWKVDQGTFRHLLARTAQEEDANIVDVLSKIDLFQDMDRKTVTKFADVLNTVKFKEGERIVEKGQQGDIFYIINEGQVRVHDIGLGDANYDDQILTKGDWFGERALMTGEPRAANVTAMTAVTAFACGRETFEASVGSLEVILGTASKTRFIKSVPIFSKSELMPIEYDHLVSMLKVRKYDKGQKLAEAGKVGDNPSLWIVKEGKLMITSKDGNIFFVGSGDYFGDKAVQADGDYVSTETCIVEEDTVCWRLKKSDIEAVIGDIKRLGKPIPFTPKTFDTSITLSDVKKHKLLGMGKNLVFRETARSSCDILKATISRKFSPIDHNVGAFGKVWLATSRDAKDPYALKTINKRQLIDAGQVKGVLREKQIMASIEHPFILPLVGSFQDDESLYLLLPLIQGGELFNVVHTDQRDGLDNDASLFYAACILEALGYLHERNIVYRDMKPENALIVSLSNVWLCYKFIAFPYISLSHFSTQ